jgi:glutathione S-transferase
MTDLVLHHYGTSPFAEKIRTVLGFKGLAWRSVEIPMIMPKPNVVALTGGYRKTPILQIGADIYCDTACIARVIERLHPAPPLLPGGTAGLAEMIAAWTDGPLFKAAVAASFSDSADRLPEGFLADRAAFSGRPLDVARIKAARPLLHDTVRSHLVWLDRALADGRTWLLGDAPGLADICAYHPVWFLTGEFGAPAALDGFSHIPPWAKRVAGFGHGHRSEWNAEGALALAAAFTPAPIERAGSINGMRPGMKVTVRAEDWGPEPTVGELVAADADDIVIRRVDERLGELHVHFPRAGYLITPAR